MTGRDWLLQSLCFFLLGVASLETPLNASSRAPIVDLEYAKYRGTYSPSDDISSFWGIRYASPPIGNLRWAAPHPPPRTSGVQNATTRAEHCFRAFTQMSASSSTETLSPRQFQLNPESEDCLFVDVHLPGHLQTLEDLPVVVWFHGGAYVTMYPSDHGDGADLVRLSGGRVVVVMVQYRLGVFGFLAGSEIKQNGNLNAGLLDQEVALKWVQKNIRKFGGDPNKVTIWGESAGAGSVLQHIISRNGQQSSRLFRSAILSSAFLPPQYQYDHPIPQAVFQDVVNKTGCATTGDALGCLRTVDAAKLQEANVAVNTATFFGTFGTVPVIDGDFVTQSVTRSLQQGRLNAKSVLAVTNKNEGNIMISKDIAESIPTSAYVRSLFPTLNQEEALKVEAAYSSAGSPLDKLIQIYADSFLKCPTYSLLNSLHGKGYKAEFAVPPANHAEDVPYYFPTGTLPPTYNNTRFINSFAQAFLNFIISGDPNVKFDSENITPEWPLWKSSHAEMTFNRTEDWKPDVRSFSTDVTLEERCRFWTTLADRIPQ